MPEETMCTGVRASLVNLEDRYIKNYLSRVQDYSIIYKALEKNDDNLSLEEIQKLLVICIHDLKEDMQYAANIMYIIPAILSRVQMGRYDPPPDLLPSALEVISLIKKLSLLRKLESLKEICFDTLLSYPDDTLVAAVGGNEEVMEIFSLYSQVTIPAEIRFKVFSLLHKVLKILPPEKKRMFVEKGITVWFSKIIPVIMNRLFSNGLKNFEQHVEQVEENVQILELLTDGLAACDYSDDEMWHSVLECICNSQKYPAYMKNLLQRGSVIWHRLWIVFIRLLKNQVTLLLGVIGTPINSMLPVVEAAFKMDVANRCRAFECWNVLIDSFSNETNESNITKRIKLLIIPLKSNNAKAEATALAKLKCWWHLIRKFQNKIDKFLDGILVSFLHFCFGKHNATDKSVLIPGHISMGVKGLCIQAMVDMVGHDNCDGCTDLPKLKSKLINTKNLVDNWNQWIFSLSSAIMMSADTDQGLTEQQMTCLWKSFLKTIGELPENNIRKDLFSEMLSILVVLIKECKSNSRLADLVFNALILPLFDGDIRIKQLLKTKCDGNGPLYKIFTILMDSSLNHAYQRYTFKELVIKLKPVTNMILDPVCSSPTNVVGFILKAFPKNDIGLTIWDALVESICESDYDIGTQNWCELMMWPLKAIDSFTDIKIPAMLWYTTNDLLLPKLLKSDAFENGLSKFLFDTKELTFSFVYFKLCITLSLIKHKLSEDSNTGCEKEIELLKTLTSNIDSYQSFEPLFPILLDRVLAVISVLTKNINETLTLYILICVRRMVTVMIQACNDKTGNDVTEILSFVGSVLKSVDSIFKVEAYRKLLPVILNDLIECAPYLSKQSLSKTLFCSVMTTFATIIENKNTCKKIKTIIDEIENDSIHSENNQSTNKNDSNFTTPKTKVPKKGKKKETSIVNTVVENGEEYVVVKSNWKFNPRKLTENQKEKFQRKREDIPALYQDLSQSQDEFKLVSWKTDSQDTSNSSKSESKSSKTGNNETASDFFSNLPSSDVVPKMLEKFFSENAHNESPAQPNDLLPKDSNVNEMKDAPKNTKSPRMALKDRVFHNVRNLIEKSEVVQKENKDASQNKTVNIIKTPIKSKINDTANIVNSAPPLLSADRPTRVKRKPKKFEELLLLTAKKSRQSVIELKYQEKSGQSDPVTTPLTTEPDTDVIIIEDVCSSEVPIFDIEVPENQDTPGATEIQNIENPQKDASKISNTIDDNNDTQTIQVDNNEIYSASLDLDTIGNIDKIKAKSNVKKVEKSNDVNDAIPIVIMDKQCNDIQGENCDDIQGENCNDNNNSNNNNENESLNESNDSNNRNKMSYDEKDEKSNNKKVETNDKIIKSNGISEEKIDTKKGGKSNDKKVEFSNDDNDNRCRKKKGEKSNDINEEETNNKKVEKSNNKKVESSNEDKDDRSKKMFSEKLSENRDERSHDKNNEKPNDKNHEESNDNKVENSSEKQISPTKKNVTDVVTPQQVSKNKGTADEKSTTKKKKSRIEKELAIDMVEGHPFLKNQSQKRFTRKTLESPFNTRRKNLVEKLNKSKSGANSISKSEKKTKEKIRESDSPSSSFTVDESQDKNTETIDQTSFTEDLPYSDDVIESSQDSSITTISVKSTKNIAKQVAVVSLQKMKLIVNKIESINDSQSILDCVIVNNVGPLSKSNQESKDDIELPLNKTAIEEISQDLTENMDTEPMNEKELSVTLIEDDVPAPLTISSGETEVGPETQEIAEADTQPTDPNDLMDVDVVCYANKSSIVAENFTNQIASNEDKLGLIKAISKKPVNPSDNKTITLLESAHLDLEKESGASSPSSFGEEDMRKQDFLNNTLEISPIKNMSPERNKKSPSPETSSDYVVIKLSSPVHSNGEPFEKCGSPEVFTEDKVSPDKRDQSPPRVEVTVTNTSPSSSLSLKKNRPQVRSGGRAAQMLGLCVPDQLQAIINPEKIETEEVKKTSMTSTPARRNLRILYNSVSENTEPTSENDASENFLKFRRSLPTVDSSPSGPILKRKLVEILDDVTISPASKRKRVSFHDPPVSTTISVQKYIEPGGVRSPQNSANKRLEKQLRATQQLTPLKSPKRLDHAFKLDTVLTKAIESFSETEVISTPDDTQAFSLDETPVVEIVRASELNDTDPICPDLLDCMDPIDNIASELSSSAMKSLLVKELAGKVETVSDLAKMTELEVNRLCIKAPKVKVAQKVLSDYISRRFVKSESDVMVKIDDAIFNEPLPDPELKVVDIEVQTDINAFCEIEVQTVTTPTTATFVQTETPPTAHIVVQTDESGSRSTADIIRSCLEERPDFVQQVGDHLEQSSIQQITDKLPFIAITDVLMKKVTPSTSKSLLNSILEEQWNTSPGDHRKRKQLSLFKDYVCEKFDSKDLVLFCSEVLKSVYDKPA